MPGCHPALVRIAAAFPSPEDINDSPQTAPSKRLEALCPGYSRQKPRLGPLIAEHIGVERIRAACPHFDQWLQRLETLSPPAA